MQRTLAQVEKKIKSLQERIIKRVKAKGIYENLGRKEQAELEIYIGSMDQYDTPPTFACMAVAQLEFMERCGNYTGR